VCQHDVAHVQGVLGAYRAGIPLLGSPSIPLRSPSPCQQPHIPFEWGGGGLGGHARALRVFRGCPSSPVKNYLKINKIQLVS
jgi:hypothetical protein